MAFVHGLTVYGIDSSDINRLGAVDRSRKVQKYFGKHKQVVPPETPPISVKIPSPKLPMDSANCGDFPNEFNGQFLTTLVEPEVITDTTISDSTCNGFFKPITHHIGQSDRITDVLKDDGCHGDDHSHPSILIGLHTCGDLAGTGLRQFIDNDTLRAVCIVGCCYHHITETGTVQCTILYYTNNTILYYFVYRYTILYYTVYYTILYYTVYYIILYCILYYIILYCILYYIILYCILYYIVYTTAHYTPIIRIYIIILA